MATVKTNKKSDAKETAGADSLWRKPITLDSLEEEDSLATLYRGREVGDSPANTENTPQKPKETARASTDKKSKVSEKPVAAASKTGKPIVKRTSETPNETSKIVNLSKAETSKDARSPKVTEEELKNILKIKSDSFQFTDIREILRGKSFDIYAYLRFLSGDAGVCKIKHLDLMKKLDISRPTLFKQGDWLTRLSLIEKRSVPGDHLGTSYTVHRVQDVLPVSDNLVRQIQSEIENYGREAD
jgi:hypothetical protein